MSGDWFTVSWRAAEVPERGVRPALDAFLDAGFTTTEEGGTEVVDTYDSARYDEKREEGGYDVGTVVDEIEEDGFGTIRLWYAGHRFRLEFLLESGQRPNVPTYVLTFYTFPMEVKETRTRDEAQVFVEALLSATRDLSNAVPMEFVRGHVGEDPSLPDARPLSEHLDHVPWLTVLGSPVVEEFGGRERVLDAPAWRVEELEAGQIMLVRTNNPVDPSEHPPGSLDAYLLEGDDSTGEATGPPPASDPFRELEPGEYGVDLVVPVSEVGGDPDEEDLEVVRCEVDEAGHLRRIEDGSFVRRRMAGKADAIGELPPDHGDEDEKFSILTAVGAPPEFVRLETPRVETVVTRVAGLDVDVETTRILDRLVRGYRVGEADLAEIDELLDHLQAIEDVDGVERAIEQRLF